MSGVFGVDVGGAFTGVSGFFKNGLVGLLIGLQLPLTVIFLVLTMVLFYFFIFRKMVTVMPWNWKYAVTIIVPYANGQILMTQDTGALCSEDGVVRFKMKKNGAVMPKPDAGDVYSNQEMLVISLAHNKKFYGRRIVDKVNKRLLIDIENPQVAQMYFIDNVKRNDPNWLLNNSSKVWPVMTMWVAAGLMLVAANLMTFYPLFVRGVFGG